jgi:hypothetical protein
LPNPIERISYGLLAEQPSGLMSETNWTNVMNAPLKSKRNQFSSESAVSLEELLQHCPLNNVQNKDVPSGCVAAIYNKYCTDPADENKLSNCHDAYNKAFGASVFKSLVEVCPSWKKGPQSDSCARAISTFSAVASGVQLQSHHAQQLNKNIFENSKWAPCRANARKGITCTLNDKVFVDSTIA